MATPLRGGILRTTSSTTPVLVPSPVYHLDTQNHRVHHPHLTPSSTTSSNDYDSQHDPSNWQYPPRLLTASSYSSQGSVSLKQEYPRYPFQMADLPAAPTSEAAKLEYPDDPSFNDDVASHTTHDGRIEMDQDEVDAIIRNKRKVRDPKACYACHRRKVKCDRNLPCDSCVKREHPELCSYERPTKKKRIAFNSNMGHTGSDAGQLDHQDIKMQSGPNVTVPKEQWERINLELQQLRGVVNKAQSNNGAGPSTDSDEPPQSLSRGDFVEREGIHAPSTQMGTMHLGSRSVLAYMMGNRSKSSQDTAREILEENILPNLGLDNETATYPFVDLWSTESSLHDVNGLCKALPEDGLCLQFWESYRDVACTIYPVVPDKDAFEETLRYMLQKRAMLTAQGLQLDPNKPYGVSMSWLALVFAVLASGAQCGTLSAKERELTSQVYICCAYQALRMANFLTHPCLETIEACLIIGNALAYNMNPGVAYIFLGMTLRSALSMGLHVNSQAFSEHETYLRGRIWWALAWQDSHFSVSYDRPSSSIMCFPEIVYKKNSTPGSRSYVETMAAIIKLTQEILRDRTLSPTKAMSFTTIQRYRDQMYRIIADAQPQLKSKSLCKTTTDHMERNAFQLHSSYMLSEICRPALKDSASKQPTSHPGANTPLASPKQGRRQSSISANSAQSVLSASSPTPNQNSVDPNLQTMLRTECINNLQSTIEAYVDLHDYSIFATRSWIGIQRSISAAFLLGILPETCQEQSVLTLLRRLEECIAKRASEDVGFDPSDHAGSPIMHTTRRVSVVNSGSRPGMSESPNWARSMTKSLHALGKLNAALAASNNALGQAGVPKLGYPQPSQLPVQHHGQTAGIYATPVVSPMGSVGINGNSIPTMSNMSQYPAMSTVPSHMQSNVPRGLTPNGIGHQSRNGAYLGVMTPITPDGSTSGSTSGGEWHYGNITERALEYVQPGLWG